MRDLRPAPFLLTASGVVFDLASPRPQDVVAQDLAHALSRLCRFGGHASTHYSVAQHSVLVSTLVPPALALAGLLHDAAEAYVGDVVSPVKRLLADFAQVEARVLGAVASRFAVPLWAFHTPEVAAADRAALLAERAALLPPSPRAWVEDVGTASAPSVGRVVPWTADEARDRFLARLVTLNARRAP